MRASAASRRRLIRCRGSRSSPALACSASADRKRCKDRRRPGAMRGRGHRGCRGHRPLRVDLEAEMFDMEYWSLEQAKLSAAAEKPLAGQIARHHRRRRHHRRARPPRPSRRRERRSPCSISTRARPRREAKNLGGAALAVTCDVTDAASVSRGLRAGGGGIRRRRYRGVERGRGLARPDRRGPRGGSATRASS